MNNKLYVVAPTYSQALWYCVHIAEVPTKRLVYVDNLDRIYGIPRDTKIVFYGDTSQLQRGDELRAFIRARGNEIEYVTS